MHHSALVGIPQRLGDLLPDFARTFQARALALFDQVVQRAPGNELHDQEGHAFVFAYVKHRHNPGMGEGPSRARFAVEPLAKFAALLALQHHGNDGLHRDDATHGRVLRPVHSPHGASP